MGNLAHRRDTSSSAHADKLDSAPHERPLIQRPPATRIRSATPASDVVEPQSVGAASIEQGVIQKHIDETAVAESKDYLPFFHSLGLHPQEAADIMARMKQLHAQAAKVNSEFIQLAEDRSAYDAKMKGVLGTDLYEAYIAFENARSARRETGEILRYLDEQGFKSLAAPRSEQEFVAALQRFPAITTETWHGPYDPAPRTLVGKEAIPLIESYIATIDETVPPLLEELSRILPRDDLSGVANYYSNRVQFFQSQIAFANEPPLSPEEDQRLHLERIMQFKEKMRAAQAAKSANR